MDVGVGEAVGPQQVSMECFDGGVGLGAKATAEGEDDFGAWDLASHQSTRRPSCLRAPEAHTSIKG